MDTRQELDWSELEPVLDGALGKLGEADRSLILARYYNRRSHASTAHELGISEDAARMRTKRALGKLRAVLGKRGIATTTAVLAIAVSANAVVPAPASLAASISSTTLAAVQATSAAPLLALAKSFFAVLAIVAVTIPIFAIQRSQQKTLKAEVIVLRAAAATVEESPPTSVPRLQKSRARDRHLNLEQILANPDPQVRLADLLKFANTVSPAQIPSTIGDLHALTPDWDQDAKLASQLLYTRWGKSDINSALDHVETLDFKFAGADICTVVAALAAEAPLRAADWLDAPENKLGAIPALSQHLAGAVGKEWARRSPNAAVDWALGLDDSKRWGALSGVLATLQTTYQDLVPTAVGRWQRAYPEEASRWKASSNF